VQILSATRLLALGILGATLICQIDVCEAACPENRADCNFTILTAEFQSPDDSRLGANVALALQHQIFKLFLFSIPHEGGDYCCLPGDTLALRGATLAEPSHSAAERYARSNQPSSLVLWGKAWPWGEYVVVQPRLSVIGPPVGVRPRVRVCCENTRGFDRQRPFTQDGEWRIWEISTADAEGNTHALSIQRFPRDAYDLPQISMNADMVEEFQSPAGWPVHESKGGPVRPGIRTNTTIVALQHVGQWTRIKSPPGWIELPSVDAGAAIDFIGGIFHFMRGNWERARSSFETVAGGESASSGIRVDAALLLAATRYRLDSSCAGCDDAIAIAKAIDPYSRITAQYEMMASLARASIPEDYLMLRTRLEQQKSLFPPDDPFTKNALSFIGYVVPE